VNSLSRKTIPNLCFAELCVATRALNENEISAMLDLEPSSVVSIGELVGEMRSPQTLWYLRSNNYVRSHNIEDHINWLIMQLEGKRGVFKRLRESKSRFDIRVLIDSWSPSVAFEISPPVMSKLGQLGLVLMIQHAFHEDERDVLLFEDDEEGVDS
jgi:hypothetical protein